MTIVVSIILVYSALNIVGNLMLYFFQYDVGNVSAYSGFVGVCFGTQVLIMLIFPLFRKFWGKAQLFMAGFLIQIIGFGVILLMAATGVYRTSSWMWLLIPGVTVYGEYKNGTRDESVTFSMQTFTVKLASGLAILIAGIVIDLIHLDTTVELQSSATLAGMRMWMTVPSALLLVIGMIVFKRFYKLDDAMMDQVMEKLHKESF